VKPPVCSSPLIYEKAFFVESAVNWQTYSNFVLFSCYCRTKLSSVRSVKALPPRRCKFSLSVGQSPTLLRFTACPVS